MNGPLTVLFVNPWRGTIGPNIGMAQLAAEALSRGHRVHCASQVMDEPARDLARLGVAVHEEPGVKLTPRALNPLTLGAHLREAWQASGRLGALARSIGADVICVNSENMLLAPRAGKLAGCPVAAIMRGMRFAGLGRVGRAYFAVQRRWVSRYVAIIQLGADMLREMGVPSEQIEVIPNGVDIDRFQPGPRRPELAAELGIGPDDRVIGTLGQISPRKGPHHLLRVLHELSATFPTLKSIIVGGPEGAADEQYARCLDGQVRELGLVERFLLPGFRRDTEGILSLLDIMVHPSETEACPRAVIEAQACGKPVVGFDVGGMPELVAKGVTGILVKPLDVSALARAAAELLSDEDRRRTMGDAARQRVLAHYDLRRNLGRTVDLLQDLARGQAGHCGPVESPCSG